MLRAANSTVRHLGIEVADAPEICGHTEVQAGLAGRCRRTRQSLTGHNQS